MAELLTWADVVRRCGSVRRARRLLSEFGLKAVDGRRFHPGELTAALEHLVDREIGGAPLREVREDLPELG